MQNITQITNKTRKQKQTTKKTKTRNQQTKQKRKIRHARGQEQEQEEQEELTLQRANQPKKATPKKAQKAETCPGGQKKGLSRRQKKTQNAET